MARSPRWGYTGLLIGVSTAVGIWILHQLGSLAAWDGVFYDHFLSWTARLHHTEPKVLILRGSREALETETEAIRILDLMDVLGARAIVFDSAPHHDSSAFYQRAADLEIVVFGRRLHQDPTDPDSLQLDEWPPAARGLDLPWGVVSLPPSLKGVYRWQQTSIRADGQTFPTVELRTAELCEAGPVESSRDERFWINFVGGPGSIPNTSLQRAAVGDLIPELVQGKVVLVGTTDDLWGLETPFGRGGETMAFAEFQANALQTLLDGVPVRPLPWFGTLALLVGLGVVSSLLYQRVTSVAGARLVLGVLAVCAIGAALILRTFEVWLPLGTVAVAQLGQFGMTLVFRTRMTNRALNEMRLHVLNQMKERFCPEDIWLSAEYWEHLLSMIHQTLDVRRMLFLERIPGTRLLRETMAVNCGFEDLKERGRSLDSPAFALPLANGRPFVVEGMFMQAQDPEAEYICPLIFDSEVLGVWVLGLDADTVAGVPHMEQVMEKLSHQVARLLYQRKRVTPMRSLSTRIREWLSAEKEDQAYRDLRSTADVLEQYYDVLEAVLSQIGTAMIVYDFFGRVLKANQPALALLRSEDFSPARATALDFLQLITGKEESEVRTLLRNVLLENSPTSMQVRLHSQGDRQFLLRVYPLSQPVHDHASSDPLNTRGIVCELIEITSLSTLASLKGVVADRLGVELRDHLAAIEMSAALLEMDNFSAAERRSVVDAIHYKAKSCLHVIKECQQYLGRDVDVTAADCYPLDGLEVLKQACATLAPKAAERRIQVQVDQPRLTDQVLASTAELEKLFSATLGLLIQDAAENTVVSVSVEDRSVRSTFRFTNCGFGIPNERLHHVLASLETPASDEFRVLRDAATWVGRWAGSLDITSEVGRGYTVTLQLRQFKLAAGSLRQPA